MEKQQLEITATVIGAVILAALLAGNFKKKPPKKALLPAAPAAAGITAAPKSALPAALPRAADQHILSLQKERSQLAWGRDPFSSSKSAKEYQMADLQLKGISFGSDKKGLAFINNEIVKSGDKVGDYEIIEVQKDRVLLRRGGQSFYLALPQE